jgi:hypothetical protein
MVFLAKMITSICLVSLQQNYSPQYDSYDVKSGAAVGGAIGYPGPAVCTKVSEHVRVLLSLPFCEILNNILLEIKYFHGIIHNSLFSITVIKENGNPIIFFLS